MTTVSEFGDLMDESEEELDERLDSMSIEDPMLVPVLMQREHISRQNAADDAMLTSFISIALVVYAILLSLAIHYREIYGWPIEYTIYAAIVGLVIMGIAVLALYFVAQFLRIITPKDDKVIANESQTIIIAYCAID